MPRYIHHIDFSNLPIRIPLIRDISITSDKLYALAPCAMFIYRFSGQSTQPFLILDKCVCRAEWLIGGKNQGDLRSIYASPERRHVYVSFVGQCAIDIFDLEGNFVNRQHLWDIAPDCFHLPESISDKTNPFGTVNKIFKGPHDEILLTTAWLSGERNSVLINLDTGNIVFGNKPFIIRNSMVHNETLYLSESNKGRIRLFEWPKNKVKPKSRLVKEIVPQSPDGQYRANALRIGGFVVVDDNLICGVNYNGRPKSKFISSQLMTVGLDNQEMRKTIELPFLEGFKNPRLDSLSIIHSELGSVMSITDGPVCFSETDSAGSIRIMPSTNIQLLDSAVKNDEFSHKKKSTVHVKADSQTLNNKEKLPTLVLDDVGLCYERFARRFLSFDKNLRNKKSFWALKHISFSVYDGETLGVIGRNGSGKSTLSMLCGGVLVPDQGNISIHGKTQMLALGVGFKVELTGRENVFISGSLLGLSKKEIVSKMDEIESFAELGEYIDEPMRTYSSGMRSRLAFAIATAVKPEILILDEIMAVGDKAFKDKAMQRMREIQGFAKSVIVVSHNPGQLKKMSTRVLWLEKGRMMMIGEPKKVLNTYDNFCKSPTRWLRKNPGYNDVIQA